MENQETEVNVKKESVPERMNEVGYCPNTMALLQSHELISENITNIKIDFERVYFAVLDTHLPHVPEDQLLKIKSDLFCAFTRGVVTATDTRSNFRQGFRLPKKTMEEINLITPKKKLII